VNSSTIVQSEKLRGLGGSAPNDYSVSYEKKQQLFHRVPTLFVQDILAAFNLGQLDAPTAAERLMISPAQLYRLRHRWLADKQAFQPKPSGGSRRSLWPAEAVAYLQDILPHCQPLNFALLSDELARRFDFHRSRPAVAHYVRLHFPNLVPSQNPGPKPRRRWQCAAIGELWQHDSSPHPWWPAERYPTLILTIDDHSRKIVAATFTPSDTTWSHFQHFRQAFETYGMPACIYTDGLSLFGHTSTADRLDTHSQFQRALTALGVAHRVAPDAPAKGKIERRFGTFQNRLVTLLAYEKITAFAPANHLLQTQIQWHNQHYVCRTTGLTPNDAWQRALSDKRSRLRPTAVPPLLDLHLAIHLQRRLNADFTIELNGQTYPVTPVGQQYVTIVHHPHQRFWVIPNPPSTQNAAWPTILASHTL
jgi:hypothetical protein